MQEKEDGLRREQEGLAKAKDRWEREREMAIEDQNHLLTTALRKAEAERSGLGLGLDDLTT